MAELRMLLLYKEYNVLKTFEQTDIDLTAKLVQKLQEKKEIDTKVTTTRFLLG
jgi:hypothetical protein